MSLSRSRPGVPPCALAAFIAIGISIGAAAPAQEFVNEEVFPSDPRVIEANSLLEDSSGWGRAIELYHEALTDDPGDLEARLWLARVLAWDKQYDQAFVQYYELLDRVPDSREVRTEYAEVLSWAGRYDEAERNFQTLLTEDPESRRAALGLARVYKWSGRAREAQRAYERVLATGEDDAARAELDELASEAGFGSHAKSDSDFVSDTDAFKMFRTGADGSTDLNPETRVLVRAGYTKVSNSLALGRDHSNGLDLLAGVQRLLGNGLTMRIEAGARRWSSSPNTALAHAELQYTPSPRTSAGFQLDYGDFLERSLSLDVVLFGVNETRGRAWLWRELADSVEGYAYFEASYISDSNARLSGGLSAEWKPWSDWPLSFGVGMNTMSYTNRSPLYYSPSLDLAAVAFARGGFELHRDFDFDLRASLGVGYARELAVASTGLTYSVEGGPSWHYDAWQVGVIGRHSQTIRGRAYMTESVAVTVGRGF